MEIALRCSLHRSHSKCAAASLTGEHISIKHKMQSNVFVRSYSASASALLTLESCNGPYATRNRVQLTQHSTRVRVRVLVRISTSAYESYCDHNESRSFACRLRTPFGAEGCERLVHQRRVNVFLRSGNGQVKRVTGVECIRSNPLAGVCIP